MKGTQQKLQLELDVRRAHWIEGMEKGKGSRRKKKVTCLILHLSVQRQRDTQTQKVRHFFETSSVWHIFVKIPYLCHAALCPRSSNHIKVHDLYIKKSTLFCHYGNGSCVAFQCLNIPFKFVIVEDQLCFFFLMQPLLFVAIFLLKKATSSVKGTQDFNQVMSMPVSFFFYRLQALLIRN